MLPCACVYLIFAFPAANTQGLRPSASARCSCKRGAGSCGSPVARRRTLGVPTSPYVRVASLACFFVSPRCLITCPTVVVEMERELSVTQALCSVAPPTPLPRTGDDLFRLIDQCFGEERGHLYPGDSALCRDVLFAPSSYFSSAANRPASPASSRSDGAHPRLFESSFLCIAASFEPCVLLSTLRTGSVIHRSAG